MNKKQLLKILSIFLLITHFSAYGATDITNIIPHTFHGNCSEIEKKVDQIDKVTLARLKSRGFYKNDGHSSPVLKDTGYSAKVLIIENSCKEYKSLFRRKNPYKLYHSINKFIAQIKQKPSEFKVSEPNRNGRLIPLLS